MLETNNKSVYFLENTPFYKNNIIRIKALILGKIRDKLRTKPGLLPHWTPEQSV